MAFSLSGNIITQTGTDTDLSGLSSITGVVVETKGANDTYYSEKKYYNIGEYELHISGTLTQDANKETIILSPSGTTNKKGVRVTSTGNFTCTATQEINSPFTGLPLGKGFTFADAIIDYSTHTASLWNDVDTDYTFLADIGSTILLEGVNIKARRNLTFKGTGSLLDIQVVGLDKDKPLFKMESETYVLSGITLIGTAGFIPSGDNKYIVERLRVDAGTKTSQHDNTGWTSNNQVRSWLTFKNYEQGKSVGVAIFWWRGPYKVINSKSGSDLVFYGTPGQDLSSAFAIVEKEFKVKITDSSLASIENVKTFIEDQDSGLRKSLISDCDFTGLLEPVPEFNQTQTYESLTDAQGETGVEKVVLAVHTNIFGHPSLPAIQNNYDKRFGNDDIVTIKLCEYRHNLSSVQSSFKGVGVKEISSLLFLDNAISEQDKSVVDSYTEIDTPEKLYDRAKSYLYDNFKGESFPFLARSGNLVDLGTRNLTIDATASQVFSVAVGGDITIKASGFSGNITTTGTVTLLNGAVVDGTVLDATQDSTLLELNGSEFTVYQSEADRDSRSNAVVSNVTRYNFLFSSLPANPLYLWVKSGSTELPYTVVLSQGENVFDLGSAGLLSSLTNQIQYIPARIYVDPQVAVSGTGTVKNPFKTSQEAINKSSEIGVVSVVILSNLGLLNPVSGLRFFGQTKKISFDLNDQIIEGVDFENITITGMANDGTTFFNGRLCILDTVKNLVGHFERCGLKGVITANSDSVTHLVDCFSEVPGLGRPYIDLTGKQNVKLAIRGYKGGLTIIGSEHAGNEITVGGSEMKLTLDSTCTAGVISVRGDSQFVDNSNGSTIDLSALIDTVELNINNKMSKLIPGI